MFRFTIRDVLWLMVVVGMGVAWWIDNGRIEKEVAKVENNRRLLQEDFDDRQKLLDGIQKEANERLIRASRFGR